MAKYQQYISKLTEKQWQTLCSNMGYSSMPETMYFGKEYGSKINLTTKCIGINGYNFKKHIFLHDYDFYIQYNLSIDNIVPDLGDATAFEHLIEGVEEDHTNESQKYFTDFMVENFGLDYIHDCKDYLCDKFDTLASSLENLKTQSNSLYDKLILAALNDNKEAANELNRRRQLIKNQMSELISEQKFIYSKLAYLDELENERPNKE